MLHESHQIRHGLPNNEADCKAVTTQGSRSTGKRGNCLLTFLRSQFPCFIDMTAWGTFLKEDMENMKEIKDNCCWHTNMDSLKNSSHLERLITMEQVSSAALMVFPLGVLPRGTDYD